MIAAAANGRGLDGTVRRVFFAVLLSYVATAPGHLYTTDEETHVRTAEAILGGGLAVPEAHDRHLNLAPGRGGRTYAYYPPGLSLLLLPLVAAGRAAGAMVGETTYLPRAAASLLGPLAGAAMVAAFAELWRRRGLSPRTIVAAAATAAFALYLWPATKPAGTQGVAAAGLLFVALLLDGAAPRAGAAGLAAGGLLLVRYETPLLAAALAAPALGRDPRAWGRFLLGLLPGAALAGLANVVRFGAPWTTGYPEVAEGVRAGFGTPWATGLAGLLVSPGRGLVWFAPATLLGAAGLAAAARRGDAVARGALLAALAALLLYARSVSWHTPAWGPRHLLGAVALCGIGLGPLLAGLRTAPRAARAAVAVLLAAGLAVNLLGVAASYDAHVDRMTERGLSAESWVFDPAASPLIGQVETLRSTTWGRVERPRAGFLPTGGGHVWTRELRRTLDVWAAYAYKFGVPAPVCLALWAGVAAAAAWAWRSAWSTAAEAT